MATMSDATMADDDDEVESERCVRAAFVEYASRELWEEFECFGCFRPKSDWLIHSTSSIYACDDLTRRASGSELMHLLLIRLMCKLAEANEPSERGADFRRLAYLEDAIEAFEQLLSYPNVDDQLEDSEVGYMKLLLVEQAVLICRVNDRFDLAKVIVEREMNRAKRCGHELKRILPLRLNVSLDDLMNLSPFSTLIDFSQSILRNIFSSLKKPVLRNVGSCLRRLKEGQGTSELNGIMNVTLGLEDRELKNQADGKENATDLDSDSKKFSLSESNSSSAAVGRDFGSDSAIEDRETLDFERNEETSSAVSDGSILNQNNHNNNSKMDGNRQEKSLTPHNQSRRKLKRRRAWLPEEKEKLYEGVVKYGVGRWKAVATFINSGRSNVDCKDKWRNLHKNGN